MCLMTLPLESIAVMSYVQDSPDHFLLLLSSDPSVPTADELTCHVFNCAQRVCHCTTTHVVDEAPYMHLHSSIAAHIHADHSRGRL